MKVRIKVWEGGAGGGDGLNTKTKRKGGLQKSREEMKEYMKSAKKRKNRKPNTACTMKSPCVAGGSYLRRDEDR